MIRAIMSEIDVVKGLRIVGERIQAASKKRGPVSKILWHNYHIFCLDVLVTNLRLEFCLRFTLSR